LSKDGIPNQSLSDDHIGIENISVEPNKLYEAVSALRNYGFTYLQCQGGYDEGPGKNLVSFYHFISVDDFQKIEKIKEVRLKVFLKRATPQNIVIGGLAGAAPPLLGWTSVTNSIDPNALLLVLIIFVWTPPHFWALAIYRKDDYARESIPMLPVTHGVTFTKLQIILYTILLVLVSLLPFIVLMSGNIYLFSALGLGLFYLYSSVKMYLTDDDEYPMTSFKYSIYYIFLIFFALLVDHFI